MNMHGSESRWRDEVPMMLTRSHLIRELEAAYRTLDRCIAEMDRVTVAAQPDMAQLATARFRISQASNARRLLVQEACRQLADAPAHRAAAIRALQRETTAYFRASTEHIRSWPPAAIQTDWPAYQDSSRAIRAKMKHGIRAEQRLLFPLLRDGPTLRQV
jgi:hypothetical protein